MDPEHTFNRAHQHLPSCILLSLPPFSGGSHIPRCWFWGHIFPPPANLHGSPVLPQHRYTLPQHRHRGLHALAEGIGSGTTCCVVGHTLQRKTRRYCQITIEEASGIAIGIWLLSANHTGCVLLTVRKLFLIVSLATASKWTTKRLGLHPPSACCYLLCSPFIFNAGYRSFHSAISFQRVNNRVLWLAAILLLLRGVIAQLELTGWVLPPAPYPLVKKCAKELIQDEGNPCISPLSCKQGKILSPPFLHSAEILPSLLHFINASLLASSVYQVLHMWSELSPFYWQKISSQQQTDFQTPNKVHQSNRSYYRQVWHNAHTVGFSYEKPEFQSTFSQNQ